MRIQYLALGGAAMLLSAAAASAAVVAHGLNLRSGPGTGYSVISTMPAGARVYVRNCGAHWCRVSWRGEQGYASNRYLAGNGAYAYAPPPVYAQPPLFSFGFGWNNDWDSGWHRDWDDGWRRDWDGGWGHHWDDDD
jgi:uncharacterized protein YraI